MFDLLYMISIPISAIICFGLANPFWKTQYPEVFGKEASYISRVLDLATNICLAISFSGMSLIGVFVIYFLTHRAKHGFSFRVEI